MTYMTRHMQGRLGCRKSNKLFAEGDSIVGKLLFWRHGKENVMKHKSGKVGNAEYEVFQFKYKELRLNYSCVMGNK